MPFNCVTFQKKYYSFRVFFPFHSFVKSSVASIGKGYPFRKMHRIFACWEYPNPSSK